MLRKTILAIAMIILFTSSMVIAEEYDDIRISDQTVNQNYQYAHYQTVRDGNYIYTVWQKRVGTWEIRFDKCDNTGTNYWDNWGTVLTNSSGYATIDINWLDENQEHYGNPGTYTIRITIEDNSMVMGQQTTRMITVQKMDRRITGVDRVKSMSVRI